MNFLRTAHLIMDTQRLAPSAVWRIEDNVLTIQIPLDEGVDSLFEDAQALFAPVE